jgi:hypothetical protein
VPVALTVEQVRRLRLPSTPLKADEKRKDRWRKAFGVDQTEIDALATLQPDVLRQQVIAAFKPWFDASLARRVSEAGDAWLLKAQKLVDSQVDGDAVAALRDRATDSIDAFQTDIPEINDELADLAENIPALPPIAVPPGKVDDERARQASSLISSTWSWAKSTRILKARKAYEEFDEDDDGEEADA